MDGIIKQLEVMINRKACEISVNSDDLENTIKRIARAICNIKRKLDGNISWESSNNFPVEQLKSEAQRLLLIELVEELSWETHFKTAYDNALSDFDNREE